MRVNEAEGRLRRLLEDAGLDHEKPSASLGWDVFKRFCREPVDCAGDGVLFEIGVYGFGGPEQSRLGFVRQFAVDGTDGEYDHMEQLHLLFTCEPVELLRKQATNLWAENFASLDLFFAAVEVLPVFQACMRHWPWRCQVEQHAI